MRSTLGVVQCWVPSKEVVCLRVTVFLLLKVVRAVESRVYSLANTSGNSN